MRPQLPEGWVRIKWSKKHVCHVCGKGVKSGGGFVYSHKVVIGEETFLDPETQAEFERVGGWWYPAPEEGEAWHEVRGVNLHLRDHWSRICVFACLSCGAVFAHDWGEDGVGGGGFDLRHWWLEVDIRQQDLFDFGPGRVTRTRPLFRPMEVIDG